MAVRVLPFQFPGIDNVCCLFQMRGLRDTPAQGQTGQEGGTDLTGTITYREDLDSAIVLRNRQELLAASGASAFAEVHQVHGDSILFEPDPSGPETRATLEADGLATTKADLALMIKTADCQPVLVAHKSGKYIGALHVGWRGNRQLFPYTAVRSFCSHYGIKAEDCCAVRGPSLGPAMARFTRFGVEWGDYFSRYLDLASSTMDLWSMTRDQLHQAGIPMRHIYSIDICTAANNRDFFSYRMDRNCGRQAALIWRKS